MQKSIMLMGRISTIVILCSVLIVSASVFDFNYLFAKAVITESDMQLHYYDRQTMLETYKSVGSFINTHSLDRYLSYLNLHALDDMLIVRFLMPLYYLKVQLLGFLIFTLSCVGFYKKTYELKHIAEQKMRIARMHGPLIGLIFIFLCVQPFFSHVLLSLSLILFAIYILVNKYYYLMGLSTDA